jgi:hypothetical protein
MQWSQLLRWQFLQYSVWAVRHAKAQHSKASRDTQPLHSTLCRHEHGVRWSAACCEAAAGAVQVLFDENDSGTLLTVLHSICSVHAFCLAALHWWQR